MRWWSIDDVMHLGNYLRNYRYPGNRGHRPHIYQCILFASATTKSWDVFGGRKPACQRQEGTWAGIALVVVLRLLEIVLVPFELKRFKNDDEIFNTDASIAQRYSARIIFSSSVKERVLGRNS